MDKITIRAMGKINLGLDVVRRMENGYHQVKMVMQTVNVYDELAFLRKKEKGIRIETDVPGVPVDKRNLIYKAASLLESRYPFPEGVSVRLVKQIPMAAGMAGGSADAAATFVGLNRLFSLGLSQETLQEMAVHVGADVPYCITGGTKLSEGIGEILSPLPSAPSCAVLLAKPEIDVSTKYVYENLHLETLTKHPDIDGLTEAIHRQDLQDMAGYMENVLETVTGKDYPVIGKIEKLMKENGAIAALMSGSGPTVFGIFEEEKAAKKAAGLLADQALAKQIFVTEFAEETCKEV